MDKAQRAEMLRALYRAKAGGMAYKPSGKPLRPNTDPLEGPGFGIWGHGGLRSHMWRPGDAFDPVASKNVGPRPTRVARKHALTSIAEQLPAKLPRVLFDL